MLAIGILAKGSEQEKPEGSGSLHFQNNSISIVNVSICMIRFSYCYLLVIQL